jgi:hypothetical protein
MPYDINNVIISKATFFLNGQPLGFTRDAASLNQDKEVLVIDDLQQIAGVADIRTIKVGFTFKINLAEPTLENHRIAFGTSGNIVIDSDTGKRRLDLDFSREVAGGELVCNTFGPANIARTIRFYRVKITQCGEITLNARGYTILPITVVIIRHPDYTKLGFIEEEYVPSQSR